MSKSQVLSVRDFRTILRVCGECREIGDDPVVWRVHFFAEAAKLVGAGLALGGEMGGCLTGQNIGLGIADWGWHNGFNPVWWVAACAALQADPHYCTFLSEVVRRNANDDGACWGRPDLIPDDAWYRAAYYENYQRMGGLDHCLFCFHSVPGKPDECTAILLYRPIGEKDFTGKDRRLVREMNSALAQFVGGSLARFTDPAPARLSPRVREVLRCLLEGDGDKQIATRLGLSPHTVNQYTKVIYRYFGVQSRAELLARWVRRGWGNKSAWVEWDADSHYAGPVVDGDISACLPDPGAVQFADR